MKPFMMKRVPVTLLTCLNVPNSGAVELRNAIGHRFQLDLPATLIFDYPTIAAIAQFLTKNNALMPLAVSSADWQAAQGLLSNSDNIHFYSNATMVVSLSSRHPGQSFGVGGFMHSMLTRADLQGPAPLSRWDNEAVYSPALDPARLTATTRFGAFCEEVESFDAAAFRLSWNEAVTIDPQVR